MKILRYKVCYPINMGTEENPINMDSFVEYTRTWSVEDEELVKQTAYNGEYTIEDDGIAENVQPTLEERTAALEAAMLEMLGVNLNG